MMVVSLVVGQVITKTGKYKIFPIIGGVGHDRRHGPAVHDGRRHHRSCSSALFMVVLGLGMGFLMQTTMLIAQNSVEQKDLGVASSAATFFRSIGGSFGVALFGAIFIRTLNGDLRQSARRRPRPSRSPAAAAQVDPTHAAGAARRGHGAAAARHRRPALVARCSCGRSRSRRVVAVLALFIKRDHAARRARRRGRADAAERPSEAPSALVGRDGVTDRRTRRVTSRQRVARPVAATPAVVASMLRQMPAMHRVRCALCVCVRARRSRARVSTDVEREVEQGASMERRVRAWRRTSPSSRRCTRGCSTSRPARSPRSPREIAGRPPAPRRLHRPRHLRPRRALRGVPDRDPPRHPGRPRLAVGDHRLRRPPRPARLPWWSRCRQSGGSPDLVEVVRVAREQGALTLAVTNAPGSPLAEAAELHLDVAAGPERAVAATKTYTAELLALLLLVEAVRAAAHCRRGARALARAAGAGRGGCSRRHRGRPRRPVPVRRAAGHDRPRVRLPDRAGGGAEADGDLVPGRARLLRGRPAARPAGDGRRRRAGAGRRRRRPGRRSRCARCWPGSASAGPTWS